MNLALNYTRNTFLFGQLECQSKYLYIVKIIIFYNNVLTFCSANSYDLRSILELLFELLTQALKYYPSNVPWLRLMGDLQFSMYYNNSKQYNIIINN